MQGNRGRKERIERSQAGAGADSSCCIFEALKRLIAHPLSLSLLCLARVLSLYTFAFSFRIYGSSFLFFFFVYSSAFILIVMGVIFVANKNCWTMASVYMYGG